MAPARFVPFDVLHRGGRDLRAEPYKERHDQLETVVDATVGRHDRAGLRTVGRVVSTPDAAVLWSFVVRHGLEGLVAKRTASRYVAGRSADWVKVRNTRRVLAVVTGSTPGTGSRAATFGALRLALLDAHGEAVPIGEVGGGFTRPQLSEVAGLLSAGRPFIVEVEYLALTGDRLLRMPTFVAVRPDVDGLDCTLEQLPTAR